jgi:broad specificity phosphatase PhoE
MAIDIESRYGTDMAREDGEGREPSKPRDHCMSGRRKWEEMMMHVVRIAVLAIATSLWPLPSYSQLATSQAEWISALRNGGHVIVIRHGATHTDQADTDPPHLENIDKQRQLNDEGRTLARLIGEAMHKLKIPVGQVYTSMFNRAVETGKLLGLGEIEPSADFTEGGLVVTPIENNRRAQALRKLTATLPPAGYQCRHRYPQAQYSRCLRQRLVRGKGRRGIDIQARWEWGVQSHRPLAGR